MFQTYLTDCGIMCNGKFKLEHKLEVNLGGDYFQQDKLTLLIMSNCILLPGDKFILLNTLINIINLNKSARGKLVTAKPY